jgi:peptidoglycan/xylan/chitin deacetylase (PgdA/CDA1 family)
MHRRKLAGLFPAVFCCALASAAPTPVLLSFDVEHDEDIAALQKLDIAQSATYFITGEFAERHPRFVAGLSTKGTIGSHSYAHPCLTELTPIEIRKDLLLARMLIEKAAGRPPVWFRAPYLETNDEVMKVLVDLGFRFDSSQQERWVRESPLMQLPVSTRSGDAALASELGRRRPGLGL